MERASSTKEQGKKPTYKYCIVPKCRNTIRNAPDKVFFLVPRGTDIRRKWCEIMKRDMGSPSSCLYCCEDHFDVEEDTDNYIQYKIMKLQEKQKTTLRLKKGILPHKFQCQKDTESQPPPVRKGFLKRNHLEIIGGTLSAPPAKQSVSASDSSTESDLEAEQEMCRVCLRRDDDAMMCMFAATQPIAEQILFATGVQFVNFAGYPTKICQSCNDDLTVAHRFKTHCLSADQRLSSLINSEPIVDTDFYVKNDPIVQEVKKEPSEEFPEDNKDYVKTEEMVFSDGFVDNCDDKDSDEDFLIKAESGQNFKKEKRKKKVIKTEESKKTGEKRKRGRKKKIKEEDEQEPVKVTVMKKRKLYCEICDLKFVSKVESDAHIVSVHGKKTWMCEMCGKVFNTQASHYIHVRSHLPPTYACSQCDFKTWHKSALEKHTRMHTGEKQFKCGVCSKAFSFQSTLAKHVRYLHNKETNFQCHVCDKRFFDRCHLNRHLDSHNNIRRYECEECRATFTRRCYLRSHLLAQHGISLPIRRGGRLKVNLVMQDDSAEPPALTVLPPPVPAMPSDIDVNKQL